MSKNILAPIIVLLLLFYSSTLPLSAFAASPSASITLSKDKRFANLSFSNIKNVSKISYVLTYTGNNRQTGFEGGLRPKPKTRSASRRQILGTCSTRFCTYHKNPHGFTLQVIFTLRTGGTSTVTKIL